MRAATDGLQPEPLGRAAAAAGVQRAGGVAAQGAPGEEQVGAGCREQAPGIRQGPLDEDEPVFKVGRTTGLTEGVISALEVDDLEVEFVFRGETVLAELVPALRAITSWPGTYR